VVLDETQLLSGVREAARVSEADGAFEDLGLEEGLHEFGVRSMAQRLRFIADGGSVFGRV
jgi:hypothetical protein